MTINKNKLIKFIKLNMEVWEGCNNVGKGQYDAYETLLRMVQDGEFDETTEDSKDKPGSCKWCGAATNNEFYCSEECDKEDEEYCKALTE